jgi:hypothetical protein
VIVLCDFIESDEGWKDTVVTYGIFYATSPSIRTDGLPSVSFLLGPPLSQVPSRAIKTLQRSLFYSKFCEGWSRQDKEKLSFANRMLK